MSPVRTQKIVAYLAFVIAPWAVIGVAAWLLVTLP